MSTSLCAGPACKCVKLVTKINLFKPVNVEEVSSFMVEPESSCVQSSTGYWSMRNIQINWGTSSETVKIHVQALDNISQRVNHYIPF